MKTDEIGHEVRWFKTLIPLDGMLRRVFDLFTTPAAGISHCVEGTEFCWWTSKLDLHRESEFRELVDTLENLYPPLKVSALWALIMQPGTEIPVHDHVHSGNVTTGVFYLKGGMENGGLLSLGNGTWQYPLPGEGLVFPSTMKHRVTKWTGVTDRVSLAFNMKLPAIILKEDKDGNK